MLHYLSFRTLVIPTLAPLFLSERISAFASVWKNLTIVQAGQRSATTETRINKNRESIQKKWNIAEVEDAFPKAIKPLNLGQTVIQKLKAIANKVNNLAAAQALFLNEAKKADGTPVPFGFAHASRILESLKENETPNMTADNKGGTAKLGSKQPTPKSASTAPQKKTTTSQSTPAKVSRPIVNC